MTRILFALVCALWGLQSLYFLYRFALKRRLASLTCAVAPIGWVLLISRELHWAPRGVTSVFIDIALVAGLLGVVSIWHTESQVRR